MTNEKQVYLIKIYMYVCQTYQDKLQYQCMRMSNNKIPIFSDEELLTVYLFCGAFEQRLTKKAKHTFAKEYLLDWFPQLPSYQTFSARLNRMGEALKTFVDDILDSFKPADIDLYNSIVDSMPIMLCTGRNRQGKVAREIADKGYCSTKNQYYYGVKLNMLAYRRMGTIPFPERYVITPASENDGTVFKRDLAPDLQNKSIFADKIYQDQEFWEKMWQTQQLTLYSPFKKIKGEPIVISQMLKAERDLYSSAVSSVRQPIEAFFNWLNEKTNIQRAHKVRSMQGLWLHLMGKLSIAFIYLIFNC